MQRVFLILSLCLFAGVLAFVARERKTHAETAPMSSVAPVWSASSTDLLAIDGLNGIVADMDRGLAPVISDSDLRARVVQFTGERWTRFATGNRSLMEDAAARHGLAKGLRCYYDAAHVAWVATNQ